MTEAKKQAAQVKNDASLFKAMVDNILELEPSEEMDKSQMILDLAQEFAGRVRNPIEKEVDHFEDVYGDEIKAIDEDFSGGCVHCGFSTVDELKELSSCPYCHGLINEPIE
jgi:predicted Zn-ribbon and HTH transcriptional regulator